MSIEDNPFFGGVVPLSDAIRASKCIQGERYQWTMEREKIILHGNGNDLYIPMHLLSTNVTIEEVPTFAGNPSMYWVHKKRKRPCGKRKRAEDEEDKPEWEERFIEPAPSTSVPAPK